MLRPIETLFHAQDYPDLLVGLDHADDAAVWKLNDDQALVLTTDFFTPVVDDPYHYGAIAAANSLSDIYAMGGKPFMALNVAALPPDLPPEVLTEVIRGGAEKAREAGVVVAGGHTVQDKEPKFGLVVVGFVHPQRMLTKGGLKIGDRLVLTKPLGFGVTTTALKREKASAEDMDEVIQWMETLNARAGELAVRFDLRAGTDITGYSLLGHGYEMAFASRVRLQISFAQIPFVSCAQKYAKMWTFPGGAADNRLYFGQYVRFAEYLDEASQMLLFDPQTSGGLLLGVASEKMDAFRAAAAELNQPIWEIGDVAEGEGVDVV